MKIMVSRIFEHLEIDRLLSTINKFHSYFESSKNCIEIGIDLIIGVQNIINSLFYWQINLSMN